MLTKLATQIMKNDKYKKAPGPATPHGWTWICLAPVTGHCRHAASWSLTHHPSACHVKKTLSKTVFHDHTSVESPELAMLHDWTWSEDVRWQSSTFLVHSFLVLLSVTCTETTSAATVAAAIH